MTFNLLSKVTYVSRFQVTYHLTNPISPKKVVILAARSKTEAGTMIQALEAESTFIVDDIVLLDSVLVRRAGYAEIPTP